MIIAVVGRSIDKEGRACSLASGKDTVADIFKDSFWFAKLALADPIKRLCMEVYGFSKEQLWGPSHLRNGVDRRYLRKLVSPPGGKGYAVICGRCYAAAFPNETEEKTIGIIGPRKCQSCGDECEHGIVGKEVRTPTQLPVFLTPRYALQRLGTEWGRHCYDETWVSYGMNQATTLLSERRGFFYLPWEGIVERVEQCPQGEFERDEAPARPTAGVVFSDIRFKNEVAYIRKRGGVSLLVERHVEEHPDDVDLTHQSEAEVASFTEQDFDMTLKNDGTLDDLRKNVALLYAEMPAHFKE
jgi:hypothetical protein